MIGTLLAAGIAATISTAALTDIRPIDLHPGVNVVPHFAPDGGKAIIVQAWRGNGNAHGYNTWFVLTNNAEGQPLGVVDLENSDLIRDDPFDRERMLGVVRFARAKVNGVLRSILIDAHLDEVQSHVLADRSTATIRVYQLVRTDGSVGRTPDFFELLFETHNDRHYCNVEVALRDSLGVPLGASYEGLNRTDGCP